MKSSGAQKLGEQKFERSGVPVGIGKWLDTPRGLGNLITSSILRFNVQMTLCVIQLNILLNKNESR